MATVAQEDAARQNIVSNFFHFVGDVLAGTDATFRVDAGLVRADGLMGPNTNGQTVGVGADGQLYVRGAATGYGTPTSTTTAPASAGIVLTPNLLLLGLLAFLVLRK